MQLEKILADTPPEGHFLVVDLQVPLKPQVPLKTTLIDLKTMSVHGVSTRIFSRIQIGTRNIAQLSKSEASCLYFSNISRGSSDQKRTWVMN